MLADQLSMKKFYKPGTEPYMMPNSNPWDRSIPQTHDRFLHQVKVLNLSRTAVFIPQ